MAQILKQILNMNINAVSYWTNTVTASGKREMQSINKVSTKEFELSYNYIIVQNYTLNRF